MEVEMQDKERKRMKGWQQVKQRGEEKEKRMV